RPPRRPRPEQFHTASSSPGCWGAETNFPLVRTGRAVVWGSSSPHPTHTPGTTWHDRTNRRSHPSWGPRQDFARPTAAAGLPSKEAGPGTLFRKARGHVMLSFRRGWLVRTAGLALLFAG